MKSWHLPLILTLTGCAAGTGTSANHDAACTAAQAALRAMAAAVEVVGDSLEGLPVEEDAPGVLPKDALTYARAGVELGQAVVDDVCAATAEPTAWTRWVGVGLKVLRFLLAILEACSVEIPEVLTDGIAALEALLSP